MYESRATECVFSCTISDLVLFALALREADVMFVMAVFYIALRGQGIQGHFLICSFQTFFFFFCAKASHIFASV